jgi:hypothetical protein
MLSSLVHVYLIENWPIGEIKSGIIELQERKKQVLL